jgi:hypothetical protein
MPRSYKSRIISRKFFIRLLTRERSAEEGEAADGYSFIFL